MKPIISLKSFLSLQKKPETRSTKTTEAETGDKRNNWRYDYDQPFLYKNLKFSILKPIIL